MSNSLDPVRAERIDAATKRKAQRALDKQIDRELHDGRRILVKHIRNDKTPIGTVVALLDSYGNLKMGWSKVNESSDPKTNQKKDNFSRFTGRVEAIRKALLDNPPPVSHSLKKDMAALQQRAALYFHRLQVLNFFIPSLAVGATSVDFEMSLPKGSIREVAHYHGNTLWLTCVVGIELENVKFKLVATGVPFAVEGELQHIGSRFDADTQRMCHLFVDGYHAKWIKG